MFHHQTGILTLCWHSAVAVQLLSPVWLFATPWTAAHQASLSFRISVCSDSRPLSWWAHPTISFSIIPSSSWPQSFPAWGSFPRSQLFTSGGQSIGASASASVLPMNIKAWFSLGWTGLISLQSKGLSSSPAPQFKSNNSSALSFLYGPTHIHTWLLEKPQLYMDLGLQSNVSAF